MKRRGPVAALFFIALVLLAAALWRLIRPAPQTGALHLTRVHFSDLPGWATVEPRGALEAFQRSCGLLAAAPPSTPVGGYGGTAADWASVCNAARTADGNAARDFFEQSFQPLLVSGGDKPDGLFTGYYEPELHGSLARHGRYQTPVYGVPGDLISVDLGAFRTSLKGEHISGRVERHRLVPYPSRAEIDDGGLPQAPALFYADDPVAVFFLHIQGSGRVVFDDGTRERVAYAAENGRPYTPIGRTL
ncbi:MAG: MltA domain-containing protein, partial [Alphaproteobacteria bacterium]|nr:MltA domain-containing protein [Alphaproteobacteria bacterium]